MKTVNLLNEINHLGLIPDGNRRWALKNNLDFLAAYLNSMHHLEELISHCFNKGTPNISVYMLSKENLERKRDDLNAVLAAETSFLKDMLPALANQFKCRVYQAGPANCGLSQQMTNALHTIIEGTRYYENFHLYLLLGYNPLDEINFAIKKKGKNGVLIQDLWVPIKVDLIIRTAGGPSLLSNFLPMQSGYAQIYISNKLFNDFTIDDLERIYEKAIQVNMLFGK